MNYTLNDCFIPSVCLPVFTTTIHYTATDASLSTRSSTYTSNSNLELAMNEHISMRVNSARLSGIKGRTVRLPCKVLRVSQFSFTSFMNASDPLTLLQLSDDIAIVEASDGGQVEIQRKVRARALLTFHNSYCRW